MKRICIIIPYFGKFPKWFNLYLYSCSKIKEIDFYYFTDCKLPKKIYKNTKFIKTTFEKYCDFVSLKLHVNFHPQSPYFLVNLKPFLSTIHDDIVKKYDFWGYADIDLIYGDMSEIINKKNLAKYDLITTHSERVAGHFTIIRYNSKYNKIAFKIRNWQKKIMKGGNWLDEGDFSNIVCPEFRIMRRLWKYIFSKFMKEDEMYYFYQRCHKLIRNKVLFEECYTTPIPKEGEVWLYNLKENKIITPSRFHLSKLLGNRELPYLHFLFFKHTQYLKTDKYWQNGFYKIPQDYDFEKMGGTIVITNKMIYIKK